MAGFGFDSEKLSSYFKGEYSEKDASYVDKVFCDNNKENELRRHLSKQFDELLSEDEVDRKNLDHILYKIHYNINTKLVVRKDRKFTRLLNWSIRIAGIIVLPLAIFWGVKGYLNNNAGKETWVEIKAPAWTRAQFSLPDGTTGWLNSNSSVKYNGNFNSDRQVTLKGEAYFDVFKDKARQFKVNANEIVVKVSGTRFNIASYDNEKNVEVVLEEGKIELNDKGKNNSLIMSPNDLVIYDKTLKNFSTEVVEPQKYLSWTEGKLVFRNDPLDVIARRLERWYNVEVDIDSDKLHDLRLRATFMDESLEQVLYYLQRSLPIDYTIEKGDMSSEEAYSKTKVILSVRNK